MKKNKVLVLFGPPKTATTSLQVVLDKYKDSDLTYLGISQPRASYFEIISNPNNYIAETLYLYCSKPDQQNISNANKLLSKMRNESQSVYILSEEMFLVNSQFFGEEWQDKIRRLKDLLSDFDLIPMIALRDPIYASNSFYKEMYASLPRIYKYLPFLFDISNYCTIYNYHYLLTVLHRIGFDKVRIYTFTKLCSSKYTYRQLFGGDNVNEIHLPKLNRTDLQSRKPLAFALFNYISAIFLSRKQKYFLKLENILERSDQIEFSIRQLLNSLD